MDKIIAIGGINVDIFAKSNQPLISHDSNIGNVTFSIGGVAKNICENLSRLQIDTTFISVIGKDLFYNSIIHYLEKLNINLNHSLVLEQSNGIYLALLNDNNDMLYGVNDMSIVSHLDVDFLKSKHEIINQFNIIILDTNLEETSLGYVINQYKTKKICVDAVSTKKIMKLKPYLNNIYLLKGNIYEIGALVGSELKTSEDIKKAGNDLLKLGITQVVITNGDKEIYYQQQNEIKTMKNNRIEPKNTTGAGDAFMSGLIYGLAKDMDIKQCIQVGQCVAIKTLEVNQANNPDLTIKDLEDVI